MTLCRLIELKPTYLWTTFCPQTHTYTLSLILPHQGVTNLIWGLAVLKHRDEWLLEAAVDWFCKDNMNRIAKAQV